MVSILAKLFCSRLSDGFVVGRNITVVAAFCLAGVAAANSGSAKEPSATPRLDVYGDPLPSGVLVRFGSMRFCADSGGPATWAAYEPHGKLLVTAGSGMAQIWDAGTGKLVGEIRLPSNVSPEHCISPDGKLLAFASDGKIQLFDLATCKKQNEITTHPGVPAKLVGWSRGSGEIIIRDGSAGQIRDVATGHEVRNFANGLPYCYCTATDTLVLEIVANRHSRQAATTLRFVHGTDGAMLRDTTIPHRSCTPLAFSPDGKWLVVNEKMSDDPFNRDDTWLCMLEVATGAERRRFKSNASAAVFSPDGTMLSVGGVPCSGVFRVVDGKLLCDAMFGNCFSPDSKILVRVGPRIVLIDTKTWCAREPLPGGRPTVMAGGKRIATSSTLDDEVLIWDCNDGRLVQRLPVPHAQSIACLPDGHTLVVGQPGRVAIWDADRRMLIRQFRVDQRDSAYEGVVVSADGTTLAVADEKAISAYAVASGELLARIETGRSGASSLVLSDDGRLLAGLVGVAGVPNYSVTVIWDIEQPREVLRIEPVEGFELPEAFIRGGHLLLTSSNHTDDTQDFTAFSIYEIATGKPVQIVRSNGPWGLVVGTSADRRSTVLASGEMSQPGVKYLDRATGSVSGLIDTRPALWTSTIFPDGRRYAASTSGGSLVLAEFAKPLPTSVESVPPIADTDLRLLWKKLAGNPADAYHASIGFATGGERTVQFLQGRWKRPELDVEKVQAAIKDLSDDNVDTRTKAHDTLASAGPMAIPLMRDALSKPQSYAGATAVLKRLIVNVSGPRTDDASELRRIREIEVLEMINSPEAQELLRTISRGPRFARETRYAIDALRRLTPRGVAGSDATGR